MREITLLTASQTFKPCFRWPLVMDVTDRSSTFLRYQDTNFLNVLDPAQMKPEVVRLALLGALRYGKAIVFDMMELDRWGG